MEEIEVNQVKEEEKEEVKRKDKLLYLTEQDCLFLSALLHQKVLTVRQAKELVWEGYNLTYVYKRIHELKERGLIQDLRLGSYTNHKIFFLTRKGLSQLKAFGGNTNGLSLPELSFREIGHDLLVTDLRIKFKELGFKEWYSERYLTKERQNKQGIPDGAFSVPTKGNIAVELEINSKKKSYYPQHLRHLFSPLREITFDLCFYFVKGTYLKELLEKETKDNPNVLIGDLNDFLANGYGTVLSKGERRFPVELLRKYTEPNMGGV